MKFIFKLLGNDPRYERWRWQMFALTWLGYAGLYLTRKSFSIAKTGIGEGTEMGLLDSQMAWIDFGYLMAYAIGQFIWGITADRIGHPESDPERHAGFDFVRGGDGSLHAAPGGWVCFSSSRACASPPVGRR